MALNVHSRNKTSVKDAGQHDIKVLISQCIAQDIHAQKALYDKFSPMAYGVIKRYTRHDEIAQEMLNDSFYKIFTKLDQYAHTGSFEGWIRRIVINTVTDHLRKYIRDKEMLHAAEMPDDVYMKEDIVGNISYKELLALIHELPDTQRAVFNLFVLDNLSHKEVGEHLGITESNSRWHLNDARKRLKEKINSIMK